MKPVSYKTVKALEFLESHGPASATEIAKEISASVGSTYRRMGIAVKHGMAARNFEEIPYRYSAAPGWREIVASREPTTTATEEEMKKVSKVTIQTCEALERGGPMTAVQLSEALCIFNDAARCRMRAAVSAGLATICRSETPHTFKVVMGWRDIVASREPVVEPKVMTRNSADLKIEYAARPRIAGPVAGTVWQGLGV